ncbi:hypothetical protein BDD12DRAFT_898017 [Trichophaea hybrida]|nr:hypothetical protein BDD12DRAFT_898017 [Trichophaea hybrida]
MEKKKTVAIIGGGASGLVTAKSMLEAGLLPTVFETRKNVGGVWAPREEGLETSQLNPKMRTNSSIFSSSFSDYFPYTQDTIPGSTCAADIAGYLSGYARQYLPQGTIRLGCQVVSVSSSGPEESNSWKVDFKDDNGEKQTEIFEYLVVATGIFSNEYIPHVEDLKNFKGKVTHSLRYVGDEVFANDDPNKKRKILVVGGCLSGAEIPADVALRAFSLPEERRSQVEIVHLFSRPFWILPKLLPFPNEKDPKAPRVLSLDQVFFNADAALQPRPDGPEDKFNKVNGLLKVLMGSDQGELGPEYCFNDYWSKRFPAIGMSESYDKFVRSGTIRPILGRFAGISEDGAVRISPAENDDGGADRTLDGVDTIVFATGYTPWPTLRKIFSPELLSMMGIGRDTVNPPVRLLHSQLHKQVVHPELGKNNNIGFIGLQPMPFWGSVELGARWLASLFSGKMQWPREEEVSNYRKGAAHLMSLGKVDDALLLCSDGGYLDIVKDLSKQMGIDPFKFAVSADHTPKSFIPAHFPPFSTAQSNGHSENALSVLQSRVTETSVSQENISRAIFAGLQGKWKLTRTLTSKLPNFPDGEFEGLAEFHPRLPTFSPVVETGSSGSSFCQKWGIEPPKSSYLSLGRDPSEYLYSEEGDLTTKSGATLHGKRQYIYQCDQYSDDPTYKVTAWFVKPDGKSVDYFFHEVDFNRAPEAIGTPGVDGDGGWKAASEHLCNKDWYYPAYRFVFKAAKLEKFWIRYRVLGPNKDYISEAIYVR